jgi:large subunit ribosomal protein L29
MAKQSAKDGKREKAMSKLRGLDAAGLEKQESSLREEIWKFRLQLTTGQLQDPAKVSRARKELARVLTIKRELELQATRESGR